MRTAQAEVAIALARSPRRIGSDRLCGDARLGGTWRGNLRECRLRPPRRRCFSPLCSRRLAGRSRPARAAARITATLGRTGGAADRRHRRRPFFESRHHGGRNNSRERGHQCVVLGRWRGQLDEHGLWPVGRAEDCTIRRDGLPGRRQSPGSDAAIVESRRNWRRRLGVGDGPTARAECSSRAVDWARYHLYCRSAGGYAAGDGGARSCPLMPTRASRAIT